VPGLLSGPGLARCVKVLNGVVCVLLGLATKASNYGIQSFGSVSRNDSAMF